MCQPGRDDDGKVYTSAFVPASGPGYWHAGFEATSSDRFIEIDLAVALNGRTGFPLLALCDQDGWPTLLVQLPRHCGEGF